MGTILSLILAGMAGFRGYKAHLRADRAWRRAMLAAGHPTLYERALKEHSRAVFVSSSSAAICVAFLWLAARLWVAA